MPLQMPLDEVFIVSIWLEAILYGFLLALSLASFYVNVSLRKHQDAHSKIMFGAGLLMFFLATFHLAINCYRLIQGYVIHAADPGGPAAWFGALAPWHHVIKDTIYATQEILGDAVAVYRTYVIWGRNWKILAPLSLLFVACVFSGYTVCGLYPTEVAGASIFDPRLLAWISTFYAVTFTQSVLTTGLMAYRIWSSDRRSAKYRTDGGHLMPIMRILVESAALQLVAEIIVLAFYGAGLNAQYILLETLTPVVGITFNAITIRIALRSSETLSSMSRSSQHRHTDHGVNAAASIPMRPITISIKQDVEAHGDSRSDTEINLDRKAGTSGV